MVGGIQKIWCWRKPQETKAELRLEVKAEVAGVTADMIFTFIKNINKKNIDFLLKIYCPFLNVYLFHYTKRKIWHDACHYQTQILRKTPYKTNNTRKLIHHNKSTQKIETVFKKNKPKYN